MHLDRDVAGGTRLSAEDVVEDLLPRDGAVPVGGKEGQQVEGALLQWHRAAGGHQQTPAMIDQELAERDVGGIGHIEHARTPVLAPA